MDAYREDDPQTERRSRIHLIKRLASLERRRVAIPRLERCTSSTMGLDEMERHASPMMERNSSSEMERERPHARMERLANSMMEPYTSPMMERRRNARMEPDTNMMGTETSIYATSSTCCPNILFLFIPGCLCWADVDAPHGEFFSYMDSATTEIFSGYDANMRSGREPTICFTWCKY